MDQQQTSSAFMSPMQQYGSSILHLTDPQKELLQMELTFRSQYINEDDKIIQIGKPLMNDEGISSVRGQVQAIVSRVTFFSNFEEKNIPMLIDFLGDTLSKDLMMNRKKYEILNAAARDRIYYIALITAYVTLKRALNNGERSFWKGSQQDIRQIIETSPSKKGLFGMFGWGKSGA